MDRKEKKGRTKSFVVSELSYYLLLSLASASWLREEAHGIQSPRDSISKECHPTPDLSCVIPCAMMSRDVCILLQRQYTNSSILEQIVHAYPIAEGQLPKGEIRLNDVSLCTSTWLERGLPDKCRLWVASCIA